MPLLRGRRFFLVCLSCEDSNFIPRVQQLSVSVSQYQYKDCPCRCRSTSTRTVRVVVQGLSVSQYQYKDCPCPCRGTSTRTSVSVSQYQCKDCPCQCRSTSTRTVSVGVVVQGLSASVSNWYQYKNRQLAPVECIAAKTKSNCSFVKENKHRVL